VAGDCEHLTIVSTCDGDDDDDVMQASLKEYLTYSSPELDEHEWFHRCLPDALPLQLRHTHAVFHLLRSP
jgi:hypothetical protein